MHGWREEIELSGVCIFGRTDVKMVEKRIQTPVQEERIGLKVIPFVHFNKLQSLLNS